MSDPLTNAIQEAVAASRRARLVLKDRVVPLPGVFGRPKDLSKARPEVRKAWKLIKGYYGPVLEDLGRDSEAVRVFAEMLPELPLPRHVEPDFSKCSEQARREYDEWLKDQHDRASRVKSNMTNGPSRRLLTERGVWEAGPTMATGPSRRLPAEIQEAIDEAEAKNAQDLEAWKKALLGVPVVWLWALWRSWESITRLPAIPGVPDWPSAAQAQGSETPRSVLLLPAISKTVGYWINTDPCKAVDNLCRGLEDLHERLLEAGLVARAAGDTPQAAELTGGFSFSRGQVLYNGKDLDLPTGLPIEVLKNLHEHAGEVVTHQDLHDESRPSEASEQLRSAVKQIRAALKKHKVRYEVQNKRSEGYMLRPL